MFGVGRPRCKKVFHVLPRTTSYYHVLPRTTAEHSFCIPTLHVGPPILLFYCSTISLQIQYCRGRCLGLAARDAKKISKYYHVLQQNVVFASRTANLACRPSYSIFLLIYYFTLSLHARDAKKRFFISDGQPCMSALLFYCFTNLLLYYLLQIQYCRGRCLGLAARDAKKAFHVLPRTTAERSFCISDGQPCMSALVLLFYYFTISLQIQFCRGRCLGLARDAKKFSTYYHVVGRPRCKNSAADVCGWPSEKNLRPMFAVGRPRCKKLCGRCLRLAVRDAKNSDRKHRPQSFLHLGQPTANIGRRVFASRTANRKHRSQSFCISDGQPQTSTSKFLHLGRPFLHVGRLFCMSAERIPIIRICP